MNCFGDYRKISIFAPANEKGAIAQLVRAHDS